MKTLSWSAAFLLALAAGAVAAQSFPSRPIRFVVGAPPGGANDVVSRIVAQGMNLGQPVLVENRPGASAMISAEIVAKAAPDGHTLLLVSQSVIAVSPVLNRITSFDPLRDFTGVALFGAAPLVLVVHPANKANSIQDIIALAKARPGELNFGSGGVGTTPYMAGTLLSLMTGIKLTSVPFQGEQASMTEIISGRLDMMFGNAAAALPHMKAGRLRGLAVTSAARVDIVPGMPTVAEAVPGFEIATWLGMVAPSATPLAVVARLNAEVLRVLDQPETKEKLHAQGFVLSRYSPEQFTQFMRDEHDKWGKVIRDAGIKAE